ncbi:NAD-dependent epimerase/dehydratase family protein [Litoricolaceae bacterium]|nr:NAD-dependent epimerase/dehydratase family protein [Litorivicinaceae bacterium]
MRSIAVVGANGFIGSKLREVFIAESSHSKEWLLECDFLDGKWLRQASTAELKARLSGKGLLHLAENPNIAMYEREDLTSKQYTNAVNLLEFSCEPKIYISSYLVYASLRKSGDPGLREDAPVSDHSAYAAHKLRVEKLFLDFGGAVVRSSNLYGGSRSARTGFVESVIRSVLTTGIVELDNGSNIRDFLFVDQFASCLFKLIQVENLRGLYNLGSGYGLSLAAVVDVVANVLGRDGEKAVKYIESPNQTLDIRYLDCSRIRHAIGCWPDTRLVFNLPKIL